MTFRVTPDGSIEVDTAEEALKLRQKILEALRPVPATTTSVSPAVVNTVVRQAPRTQEPEVISVAWNKFIRSISGRAIKLVNQRRVLVYYRQIQGGASVPELKEALHLKDGKEAGGYVSGLRRRARTAGLNSDDVLTRDSEGKFHAGPLLLSAEEIKV
jgi:hypothetical protein